MSWDADGDELRRAQVIGSSQYNSTTHAFAIHQRGDNATVLQRDAHHFTGP
jgi:hypothetical protein